MKNREHQYQQSVNRSKAGIYFFWCTIFCFLFLHSIHLFPLALDPGTEIPEYIHEVWQIEDGLP
jgi:hypothetical protein